MRFTNTRNNSGNDWILLSIPVDGKLENSELAYGFNIVDDGAGMIWLPKSQTKDCDFDGATLSIWARRWLVEKKDLGEYQDTSHEPSLFD